MPDDPRTTQPRATTSPPEVGDRAIGQNGLISVISKDKAWPPKQPNKMDWAVRELKKINNRRLIQSGQFYWRDLAQEALETLRVPKPSGGCPKWKDPSDPRRKKEGNALFSLLSTNYLQEKGPKTGKELAYWFQRKGGRITWCDHDALMAACIDKCFNTVYFMIEVLRKVCAFPVKGKSYFPLDNASSVEALAAQPLGWPGVLENIKKTLDNGYLFRAQVGPRHSVLIIGHDGHNRLIYWNTVSDSLDRYGRGFGEIIFEPGNNAPEFGGQKRNIYKLHTLVPLHGSRCKR
jgi:hypothetical protein